MVTTFTGRSGLSALSLITRREPSGAQSCLKVMPFRVGVTCRTGPPWMPTAKSAVRSFGGVKERNVTVCPSGETSGVAAPPGPVPSRRRPLPFNPMIQIASSSVAGSNRSKTR
jgi:hypothetical protein